MILDTKAIKKRYDSNDLTMDDIAVLVDRCETLEYLSKKLLRAAWGDRVKSTDFERLFNNELMYSAAERERSENERPAKSECCWGDCAPIKTKR